MQIIHLGEFPERPTQEDAARAMEIVASKLGGEWFATTVGGKWNIYRDGRSVIIPTGRRFEVALGMATGCAIVCTQLH